MLVLPCLLLSIDSIMAAPEAAPSAVANSPGVVAQFTVNNLWMMIAVTLVFIMHLGFATLEVGLTRAKNTVNILFKNIVIVAIGFMTYTILGFSLMYPANWLVNGWLGFSGLGIESPAGAAGATDYADGHYTYCTDFMFQAMFAATAATIVSGAVAERVKLNSFLLFSTVYVMIVYPVIGSWGWGKGWLDAMGFHDFAGSTFVHAVGGWGALAGILFLGPRIGKYANDKCRPIPGHNLPLAAMGVFFLWLGWFGFNGGSVLSADPVKVSYVFVTTFLASTTGIIGAMLTTWFVHGKPDLSMVLNGCLGGLVAVTAGADVLSVPFAGLIGFLAGIIVVFSVEFFDRIKVDDPVGALSVHLVCGILGTLAVGFFSEKYSVTTQLIGVAATGAVAFASACLIFAIIRFTLGLRVTKEEELRGLDISEHGMEAYPSFQIFTNQ